MQLGERNALGRILGMQVEREPFDGGVELAPYPLGRNLAEPAERSDVVAPDQDRMVGHICCNACGEESIPRRAHRHACASAWHKLRP
jgi:hypothetical protein